MQVPYKLNCIGNSGKAKVKWHDLLMGSLFHRVAAALPKRLPPYVRPHVPGMVVPGGSGGSIQRWDQRSTVSGWAVEFYTLRRRSITVLGSSYRIVLIWWIWDAPERNTHTHTHTSTDTHILTFVHTCTHETSNSNQITTEIPCWQICCRD